MKFKTFSAWFILLFLSFVPVIFWYFLGENLNSLNYGEITHAIGQIAGLVGMSMFALTFILAAKIKFIENAFDGLDKVYVVHRVFGTLALFMILIHPIFLVIKYVPENFKLAATYLLPFHSLSVDFGILALLGMFVLILASFYSQIKYQYWKISHKFLGLIFLFAVIHIFLIRNDAAKTNIFTGYYLYALIVTLIGLIGYLMITIKNIKQIKSNYVIETVINKNNCYDITLKPINEAIKFRAGQFFFLKFHSKNLSTESHPFSVATSSNSQKLRFIIKNLGDFTSKLSNLKIGDSVSVNGPYGKFNRRSKLDKVWIAGGIGITPFIGMSQDLLNLEQNFKVNLFYCVRDESELIENEQFKKIEVKTENKFNYTAWLSSKSGYINVDEIKKICGNNLNQKVFYICGPQNLKDSIIKKLLELKVSKNRIHQEEFNFK